MSNKKYTDAISWMVKNPGYLKKGGKYLQKVFAHKRYSLADITMIKQEVREQLKRPKMPPLKLVTPIKKVEIPEVKKIHIVKSYNKHNNVLIIGDTHLPFEKEGYLEFCLKLQLDYQCDKVIHIGDLVDNHAVSYHDHDPDGRSPGDEYKLALEKCEEWYKAFPNVKICIGNHDRLPFRKAFTAGLPKNWLKSYQEMFNSPTSWKWDFIHKEFGVIYQHGTGMSGEMASVNASRENRQSTVIGHLHTVCNTRFLASEKDLIFGMSVGCGIDHRKYAFAYGKENTRKPVIAAGIVVDGKYPINVPMVI